MKIKSVIKRGEQQYVVDGRVNGKRKRTFFKSKKNARAYLASEKTNRDSHEWWIDRSPADRIDLINAFEQSRENGFKLLDAVQRYSVKGRGETFLKKITVGEAIGTLERVFNSKRQEIDVKATGYLKTKVTRGCSHQTLWTSRCTLLYVMGLREKETEENYVRSLATGLCTVWNNNPKAFKWWSELV